MHSFVLGVFNRNNNVDLDNMVFQAVEATRRRDYSDINLIVIL